MTESTLQLISFLKLIVVAVCGLLYGLGGMKGKYKRRYVMPVVFGLAITGFTIWTNSFHWAYLLCVPLFFGSLSLGYGASSTPDKIKKRAIAGAAAACSALPIFVVTQAWTLLFLHILVATSTSIIAGTWNQTQSARAEETLIGASYVLIPILTM
jgi:uncharacterized membrane protein